MGVPPTSACIQAHFAQLCTPVSSLRASFSLSPPKRGHRVAQGLSGKPGPFCAAGGGALVLCGQLGPAKVVIVTRRGQEGPLMHFLGLHSEERREAQRRAAKKAWSWTIRVSKNMLMRRRRRRESPWNAKHSLAAFSQENGSLSWLLGYHSPAWLWRLKPAGGGRPWLSSSRPWMPPPLPPLGLFWGRPTESSCTGG